MSLHLHAYLRLNTPRVRRFIANVVRSKEIQRELLQTKLRRHADSDFGRRHGFAKIRNVHDYRRQMPITTYEYYREYVERLENGEITAMFHPGTHLLMFANTTGTTGRSKNIPITKEFFK